MFATRNDLLDHGMPELPTRKALVIINLQNDLFYVQGDIFVTKNRDFIARLKEMIPFWRKIGDVIWVKTEFSASPVPQVDDTAQVEQTIGRKAESNRRDRIREEEALEDDVTEHRGPSPASELKPPRSNPVFPSSRSRNLMKRRSADTRAKRREADSRPFDEANQNWQELPTKPRKGQRSDFCVAGTEGAEILDGLKDLVDESRDLIIVKHYYSAFDQTSLLTSLRMSLTTEVYLCGCLTNTAVYTTAADAVQHGLQVTIVEDCLGYHNELRHDEAVRQMADIMGVNGTDSEEIIEDAGGRQLPAPDTPGIRLEGLSIGKDVTASQAALVNAGQSRSAAGPWQSPPSDINAREERSASEDFPKAQIDQNGAPFANSENFISAKLPRRMARANAKRTLGPEEVIASGDSKIINNALSQSITSNIFERLKAEIDWQKMYHRGGEVPRLIAVQGQKGDGGEAPIYRHPADESPPLKAFTGIMQQIRSEVESLLSQPFNHALVQLYRGGADNISEHSDKTLDLIRDSRIVNVSLGAHRIMTLRTKKESNTNGVERQTQRINMPHNSIFVLGPRSNREWLHGIRADKRPHQEKTQEELAYNGERISITFRQIGTFHNVKDRLIWGSGATSKEKDHSHQVSNDESDANQMLQAFGRENQQVGFDWNTEYGSGFDVVDLVVGRGPELTLSPDPVADLRVRLALSLKSIKYSIKPMGNSPADFSSHPWTHGLSNLEKPIFSESDSETQGDLAILLYLEKQYPSDPLEEIEGATCTQLFRCAAESSELLYIWREYLADPPSSPTHRFKLEPPTGLQKSALEEIQATLDSWEEYLIQEEKPFVAGEAWTILDCAFWPVLQCLIDQWDDFPRDRYPGLTRYYSQGIGKRETMI